MSGATGQVDPTSSIRCRRSDQPTGRGFDPSNARMTSISLWAKVGSPGGGRSSSHTARAVQKIDGGEAAGWQADTAKIDLAWRWPLRLTIVRQPGEGRQNSWQLQIMPKLARRRQETMVHRDADPAQRLDIGSLD